MQQDHMCWAASTCTQQLTFIAANLESSKDAWAQCVCGQARFKQQVCALPWQSESGGLPNNLSHVASMRVNSIAGSHTVLGGLPAGMIRMIHIDLVSGD